MLSVVAMLSSIIQVANPPYDYKNQYTVMATVTKSIENKTVFTDENGKKWNVESDKTNFSRDKDYVLIVYNNKTTKDNSDDYVIGVMEYHKPVY